MATLTSAAAIATRDRPDSLGRLIDALLAGSRRPDEIIIIDDGQLPAGQVEAWRSAARDAGVALACHRKDVPGRNASRNLAARRTRADVLLYLDDDCEPASDFVARLLGALEADASGRLLAVEGETIPPGGWTRKDRIYQRLTSAVGWWKLPPLRRPHNAELPAGVEPMRMLGGVVAVRRSAVLREPFDETLTFGEDREFSLRVARHGAIGRVSGAVCLHHHDPAGRRSEFAAARVAARNYLRIFRKLYGRVGQVDAAGTLLLMSLLELGLTLGGNLDHARRAGGYLAGLLSPRGRRGERERKP